MNWDKNLLDTMLMYKKEKSREENEKIVLSNFEFKIRSQMFI